MALVSSSSKFVIPDAYLACSHGHVPPLQLESSSISGQVADWTRIEQNVKVVKYNPSQNKLTLSNGKEFTYKALVLAPGFHHNPEGIEGLPELRKLPEADKVFVHMLDNKDTNDKNYYHGWDHVNGDMLCYSPKGPYKGEGTDFWACYYESFMRQDKLQGRTAQGARIQYWTPNKEIFRFSYANEIALEECHKRGIDVMLGWELKKVWVNSYGEKMAQFVNVDNGQTLEKPFNHMNINPPSQAHKELVEAGITDESGLIDVNPFTLQHSRFENIFAWGDAIKGETTRTQHAAIAQCPVVKHNLTQFMDGKELNGIYDGYSFMPFYLSHSHATGFSHTWNYEPTATNHWCPQYGVFAQAYFNYQMKGSLKFTKSYSGLDKNHGPPHKHWNKIYDPLDKNEYLASKGIDVEALRNVHKKGVVA